MGSMDGKRPKARPRKDGAVDAWEMWKYFATDRERCRVRIEEATPIGGGGVGCDRGQG